MVIHWHLPRFSKTNFSNNDIRQNDINDKLVNAWK